MTNLGFVDRDVSLSRLPDSLRSIVSSLSQTSQFTSQDVYQSLLKAQVRQEDLMPWADFAHPVADSYGRQLVYDGGYFEIMVMSWVPGDVSAIHDHGQTQWGAVQCFGRAIHTVYNLSDYPQSTLKDSLRVALRERMLHTVSEMPVFPGQILEVGHDLIHQMSNYSPKRFLSLHVYGCYDRQDSITGDARIFDLLEGKIQHTNGGVFFCLPEAEISHRSQTLAADYETTLRHHQQMSDRITRILENSQEDLAYWQSKLNLVQQEIRKLAAFDSLIGT